MWSSVSIVQDAAKGRCLVARRAFSVGEPLYTETAFVIASCKDLPQHQCFNYAFQAFKPRELEALQEMTFFLADLSRVGSVDTARNLLELLALYRLRAANELEQSGDMAEKFALFGDLTAANLDECVSNMRQFRRRYPTMVPKSVTDAAAGALLGILNTNQVEVESELCGSGLFVGTAVAEHDCSPNASYSTAGSELTMTAIRPIAPGERVSIDYGNYYYDCTPERIASLYESYNFICTCHTCVAAPDRKRAFVCRRCCQNPATTQYSLLSPAPDGVPFDYCHGVVTPVGCTAQLGTASDGATTLVVNPLRWVCGTCGSQSAAEEVARFEAAEAWAQALRHGEGEGEGSSSSASGAATDTMDEGDDDNEDEESPPPLTFAQLQQIVSAGVLHPSHHIVFWSLADLSMQEVEQSRTAGTDAARLQQEALHYMLLLSRYVELFLPAVHHEKMVHYDRVAQLFLATVRPVPALGQVTPADRAAIAQANAAAVANAKLYFGRAHQCCLQSCGASAHVTQVMLALATNTPTTVGELTSRYTSSAAAGSEQEISFSNGVAVDNTKANESIWRMKNFN